MKHLTTLLLFLAFLPVTVYSQSQSKTGSTKQALIQLNRDLYKALLKADAKTVGNILADDYKFISYNGHTQNKKQYIADMSPTPLTDITAKDTLTEVRLYGATGIVTGKWIINYKGNPLYMISTDVFTKGNNGWKLAHTHESQLPAWKVRKLQDKEFESLSALDCAEEPKLKSLNSDLATFIRIKNNTPGTVTAYWINYEGKRDSSPDQIRPIKSGQSSDLSTYVTHPFVMVDASGKCLGIYQPTTKPGIINLGSK